MTAQEFVAIAMAKAVQLGLETAFKVIMQAVRGEHPELGPPPPKDHEAEINAEIDKLRAEQDAKREVP